MKSKSLHSAFLSQLSSWPMARDNYAALSDVKVRDFSCGGYPMRLQFNPARVRSTAAKVDAASVAERPCFLCDSNRPAEQEVLERFGDWNVLANPFPIFPEHYTIVHSRHQDQNIFRPEEMARFASEHRSLICFYNGARSGASCPDHLHFQATDKRMMPAAGYFEANPGTTVAYSRTLTVSSIPDESPAPALLFRSPGYNDGLNRWLTALSATDPDSGLTDPGLKNILMWTDGELHTLLYLRSRHRPACFFAEGDDRRMVSPGAVDMTGFLILPRPEDFERLTPAESARILEEVGFDFRTLDSYKTLLMR